MFAGTEGEHNFDYNVDYVKDYSTDPLRAVMHPEHVECVINPQKEIEIIMGLDDICARCSHVDMDKHVCKSAKTVQWEVGKLTDHEAHMYLDKKAFELLKISPVIKMTPLSFYHMLKKSGILERHRYFDGIKSETASKNSAQGLEKLLQKLEKHGS